MTGSDDEFEDFLKRRKPVFRAPDDMFEPPAELDRVVLRQAKEAIETEQPLRVFRGPRWAMPFALAATLVLAFTVVFHAGMPQKRAPVPEVTVQNVSQEMEYPETAAPAMAANNTARSEVAAESTDGSVVVDLPAAPPAAKPGALVSSDEAGRYAAQPPPAAPVTRARMAGAAAADSTAVVVTVPAAKATESPAWRRDAKTWLAEIERLRNAGDTARADAELAEYKRQQRAYAGAPDR